MACVKVTCSKGLGPADKFNVWGALRATSVGGEPNLQPLGQVVGSIGTDVSPPVSPVLTLSWTRLVFQRAGGAGSGNIEVQGAAWSRVVPLEAAIPVAANDYSAPLDLSTLDENFALSLDDAATAADRYEVFGTNDGTARVPPSAAGANILGEIRGAGTSAPIARAGYRYAIVKCLAHGAATKLVGVQNQPGGPAAMTATGVVAPLPNTLAQRDGAGRAASYLLQWWSRRQREPRRCGKRHGGRNDGASHRHGGNGRRHQRHDGQRGAQRGRGQRERERQRERDASRQRWARAPRVGRRAGSEGASAYGPRCGHEPRGREHAD